MVTVRDIYDAIEIGKLDIASALIEEIKPKQLGEVIDVMGPDSNYTLLMVTANRELDQLSYQLLDKMRSQDLAYHTGTHHYSAIQAACQAGNSDLGVAIAKKITPADCTRLNGLHEYKEPYFLGLMEYVAGCPDTKLFIPALTEIVDKMDPSQLDLFVRKKDNFHCSPLQFDIEDKELTLKILEKMPLSGLGEDLTGYDSVLEYYEEEAPKRRGAAKADKKEIAEAIRNKIANDGLVPFIGNGPVRAKANYEIAKAEFPDPKRMVRQALDSNSSADALMIGSDLLHACTRFFAEVQKSSQVSLETGMEARKQFSLHLDRAMAVRQSLQDMAQNPERLEMPSGVSGFFTVALRTFVPALDPYRTLTHDFTHSLDLTRKSHEASVRLVRAYESFKAHYPTLEKDIQSLQDALSEGIAELDKRDKKASPEEKIVNSELKDIFLTIQKNASDMSTITLQNAQAVDISKSTEVKFACSILNLQTAFAALATNITATVAQIKDGTTQADSAVSLVTQQLGHLDTFNTLVAHRAEPLKLTHQPSQDMPLPNMNYAKLDAV